MPPFVQKAMAGPEEQDKASCFSPKTLELLAGAPACDNRLGCRSCARLSAMRSAEQQQQQQQQGTSECVLRALLCSSSAGRKHQADADGLSSLKLGLRLLLGRCLKHLHVPAGMAGLLGQDPSHAAHCSSVGRACLFAAGASAAHCLGPKEGCGVCM